MFAMDSLVGNISNYFAHGVNSVVNKVNHTVNKVSQDLEKIITEKDPVGHSLYEPTDLDVRTTIIATVKLGALAVCIWSAIAMPVVVVSVIFGGAILEGMASLVAVIALAIISHDIYIICENNQNLTQVAINVMKNTITKVAFNVMNENFTGLDEVPKEELNRHFYKGTYLRSLWTPLARLLAYELNKKPAHRKNEYLLERRSRNRLVVDN